MKLFTFTKKKPSTNTYHGSQILLDNYRKKLEFFAEILLPKMIRYLRLSMCLFKMLKSRWPTDNNSTVVPKFNATRLIGQHSQCLIAASHTPNWYLIFAWFDSSVSHLTKFRQITIGFLILFPVAPKKIPNSY